MKNNHLKRAFAVRDECNNAHDYREIKPVNIAQTEDYFRSIGYESRGLMLTGRHVHGTLTQGNNTWFVKVATSRGVGIRTRVETAWNKQICKLPNAPIYTPLVHQDGYINGDPQQYFLMTEYIDGQLLVPDRAPIHDTQSLRKHLPTLIAMTRYIATCSITDVPDVEDIDASNPQEWFMQKTHRWYDAIPDEVKKEYRISELVQSIESSYKNLEVGPRHGDFAPWHVIVGSQNDKLTLIDAEHARIDGVVGYDAAYLIQRLFCVLEQPELARSAYELSLQCAYDPRALKTILAARAIGGYLDATMLGFGALKTMKSFSNWISSL